MKAKLGKALCWNPDCGEQVVVKQTDKGGLSYSCQNCGFTPFFRPGDDCTESLRKSCASDTPGDVQPTIKAAVIDAKKAHFEMNNL